MSHLTDLLTPAPEGWQWVVLHAKPRCEKKVVSLTAIKEAECYLPCTTRVHTYGKRERKHEVPLFPGYVFGRMPSEHIPWYRANENVANVIPVLDEKKLLAPLQSIAASLEAGLELEVTAPLGPGTRVKVTAGPLKGLETEVHSISGSNRVVLELEMIQKIVTVEIDAAYLKRID
jgi:transcription antitermination factor NusG